MGFPVSSVETAPRPDHGLEDELGHGAAADIAVADEEDLYHVSHRIGGHPKIRKNLVARKTIGNDTPSG